MKTTKLYLVVDIGATKTRIGIANENELLVKYVYPTPTSGGEDVFVNLIVDTVRSMFREYLDRVESVGVATIGPLDIRNGRVVNTPNIPIKNFELLRPLREILGKPVYVVNDAVAAVYGEKHFGDARGFKNIVYVTLSTGVGGGAIVDDELLLGKQGNAHEIGHIVVKYDSSVQCGCGGRGHWEAYAGGANIPKLAKYLATITKFNSEAYYRAILNEITAPEVFSYYRAGDPFAKLVVEEIIEACIAGFSTIINLYDPEIILIGGSVFLNNADLLLNRIINGVSKNIVTGKPLIKPSRLGDDACLYGALAVAKNPPPKLKSIQGCESK